MPLELGAGFAPRRPVVEEPQPAKPTVEDLRTEQLLVALAGLQEALNNMQAPVVNVAEPDLTAIVQAVTQLKGPATAEEIAQAVKAELAPTEQPKTDAVLEDLAGALKQLDFRMKGIGGSGGGGPFMGSLDISSRADRDIGRVTMPDGVAVTGVAKTDDDETQALLTTLRDTVLRRTDTAVTTSSVAVAATSQDRAWLAGTGRVTLNIAGNLRILISNTSTTMPVLLLRIAGLTTATGWAQVISNPTAGLPATPPRTNQNARFGSGVTVTTPVELRVDASATTPLAGGTDTGIVLGLPGGARTSIDLLPLRVDPQQTVGINVPFAGAAEAAMSIYWMNAT